MKALVIPFGYPGYPEFEIKAGVDASLTHLSALGVAFDAAPCVGSLEACEGAIPLAADARYAYVIVVLTCWVEPPWVTRVLDYAGGKPVLLWAHDVYARGGETETMGAIPCGCVMREALEALGYTIRFIVGQPGDAAQDRAILAFDRAARGAEALRHARLGAFGSASMGMYTGYVDHMALRRALGPEIVWLDQYTLISEAERIGDAPARDVERAMERDWKLPQGCAPEPVAKTARLYLALKKLAQAHKLDAATVKCQYEMSVDYGFAPCVALSLFAADLTTACEGDLLCLVSQYLLHVISGEVSAYGDVHSFEEHSIALAACGFAPSAFLKARPAISRHTALYEGLMVSESFKSAPMVTIARLGQNPDGTFRLHATRGRMEPLDHFHEINCPAYAGCRVFIEEDVETFKQRVMSQHYAVVPGDYLEELRQFARIRNIRML